MNLVVWTMGKSGSQLSSAEVWFVMEEVSGTKSGIEIDKDVSRRGRHDFQPAKSTAPTIVIGNEIDERLEGQEERTKESVLP
jgi:hypothetical protein